MAVSTVASFVGRTRQCLNDRWAGFPCATCPTVAQKLDIPVARASPHSVTARVSAVFAWPRFYSSVSGNRGSLPGELFAICLPQLRVRNSGPPIQGTACRTSLRCRPGNVFAFLLRFRFASSFLRGELYLARVQPSNNIPCGVWVHCPVSHPLLYRRPRLSSLGTADDGDRRLRRSLHGRRVLCVLVSCHGPIAAREAVATPTARAQTCRGREALPESLGRELRGSRL